MNAGFVGPDSPRWAQVLSEVEHDFYHLPGYLVLSARQEQGEPAAFLAEEGGSRFLVPLVLRPVSPGPSGGGGRWFDATSPYGYPGPLLVEEDRSEGGDFLARAVGAFTEGLRRRQVVAAFLRFHPLLPLPPGPFTRAGCLVRHGETVSIDLTLSPEEIWGRVRENHRRHIKQASKKGQTARIDEHWQNFDTFIDLYYETMRRARADQYYFFSRDYLAGLRQALGDRLHLCVVEQGGQVISAGLFTETCGMAQYHLSGTREDFLADHPLKTMIDFVRRRAQERGNRVLHLGGGRGGKEDSLFHFKKGFSKTLHPFFTWRAVLDRPAYHALVGRWEARAGAKADGPEGYFPAYRGPLPGGEPRDHPAAGGVKDCLNSR
jgi:hypothetical protein